MLVCFYTTSLLKSYRLLASFKIETLNIFLAFFSILYVLPNLNQCKYHVIYPLSLICEHFVIIKVEMFPDFALDSNKPLFVVVRKRHLTQKLAKYH